MQIPDGIIVALTALSGSSFMGWAAYVTKQLVEHARLIAILHDRSSRPAVAFAAHEDHPPA